MCSPRVIRSKLTQQFLYGDHCWNVNSSYHINIYEYNVIIIISAYCDSINIPKISGLVGLCATCSQIINTPDAYNEDTFDGKFDKMNNYSTKSVLCCPIINKQQNEVIAVLQCINKYDGQTFNVVDEAIISCLCNQIAVAMKQPVLISNAVAMKQPTAIKDTLCKHGLISYFSSNESIYDISMPSLLFTLGKATLDIDRMSFCHTINSVSLYLVTSTPYVDIVLKRDTPNIIRSALSTQCSINIPDCYKDSTFDAAFDIQVMPIFSGDKPDLERENETCINHLVYGYIRLQNGKQKPETQLLSNVLIEVIVQYTGNILKKIIAIVQLINKDNGCSVFTKEDGDLLSSLLQFIRPILISNTYVVPRPKVSMDQYSKMYKREQSHQQLVINLENIVIEEEEETDEEW